MTAKVITARRVLIVGLLALAGGLMLLAIMALAATALILPRLPIERQVTLVLDGQPRSLRSTALSVNDLLDEQRIPLGEGDSVTPALNAPLSNNLSIQVNRAHSVTLTIDGQSQVYRTQLTNPAQILASAGHIVGPNDDVIVDGTRVHPTQLADWPVPAMQISLRRTVPLNIVDDGAAYQVQTTSQLVGEALFEAGVTLFLADLVSPDLNEPITPGMTVEIQRAQTLFISADGTTVETRVRAGTVADALAESGLALVGQDYTIPAEDTPLLPGMRVRVIRVTEEILSREIQQPYETVFQGDGGLELDQRQVIQTGQDGIVRELERVRYENGIEVARQLEETEVVQEVRNQVIAYGTNVVLRTIETANGPRQYWRRVRMWATSYHPAALGGDSTTATGATLQKGIVASNPDIIPYGTQVFVPGYGVGEMADTGPLYRPLFIDLGYSDADWVSWARWVDVYLLAPVPEHIIYLLPQGQ